MKKRIIRTNDNAYVVMENTDGLTKKKYVEVYEYVEPESEEAESYIGDWLCDVDLSFDEPDEEIIRAMDIPRTFKV